MKIFKLRALQMYAIIKYLIFKIFSFSYKKKYSNIWLISERGDEARDNGYSFYLYLKEFHPEIKVKYLISKKSKDINKFIDKDDLVYLRSNLHFKLYISSNYLISSHIMGYAPEYRSFTRLVRKFKIFKGSGRNIFLQHGIIKDYIENLISENTIVDLFVCGSKPEYDYISKKYGYKEGIVNYTGLSRYDYLKNEKSEENFILLMTTWRKNMFHINTNDEFRKTEFFKYIDELLKNKELNELLEKNNIKLLFYPHFEFQKYIDTFEGNENIIIASNNEYQVPDLLRKCKLLITDYSSVFFDVAYLKKPTIYYQFDYDSFRKNHYGEGYFSYQKDGFGPVLNNSTELVNRLNQYIKNNYRLEDKYLKRIDSTFVYFDKKNSERIYEQIIKLK